MIGGILYIVFGLFESTCDCTNHITLSLYCEEVVAEEMSGKEVSLSCEKNMMGKGKESNMEI